MSLWHGLEGCEDTCYSTLQGLLQGPEIDSHPEAQVKVMLYEMKWQVFFKGTVDSKITPAKVKKNVVAAWPCCCQMSLHILMSES